MSYPPITEKRKTQEENRERERERNAAELFNRNKSDMQTRLRNSTNWKTKKDSKKKLTNHKQYSTVWQIRFRLHNTLLLWLHIYIIAYVCCFLMCHYVMASSIFYLFISV
jgi:hypothetical protein